MIAGLILFVTTDIVNADNAAELLAAIDADQAMIGTALWLFTLFAVLWLIAVPGIFQALRPAGDLVWIAFLAAIIGSVFFLISSITYLGVVYQLAPEYVASGASSLLVVGDTLITTSDLSRFVGDAVSSGIGVLVFSLVILRSGIARKWIGWLGLVVALAAWLGLLSPVAEVFEIIGLLAGTIGFAVWMIAIGVTLLRTPGDTATA
ncbi:MAG: DUF4386 family protein [Chloroflexi bacterium]|nr:DUF4386 family protein [Chloroflexota bacterium]